MGQLVDGQWSTTAPDRRKTGGRFERADTTFREWVTADGSSGFKAEAGRYRLIVSHACPWAHRTMIFRALKGLAEAIDVTVVDAFMGEAGWILPDGQPIHTVYTAAKADYTGRASVPVLWDEQTRTIVSNESSEIIRMLNAAFDEAGASGPDFYPERLRDEIEAVNERVYHTLNNGVYRAGFATDQEVYTGVVNDLFATLDWLEERLSRQAFVAGDQITEADWRLFTTLVRFDPVYHGHFKCNVRRLVDYPNLWDYTLALYQVPGVAPTVHMDHIKEHYYQSHVTVNPTGIVPMGPDIDYTASHGRGRFGKDAA